MSTPVLTCQVAKQLIAGGSNVNARNKNLSTSLLLASFNGNAALVRELIRSGADVNARDRDGLTSLMYASHEGHTAVIAELLKARADINARGSKQFPVTALTWAVEAGNYDVWRLIRSAGAAFSPAALLRQLCDLPRLSADGHWPILRSLLLEDLATTARDPGLRRRVLAVAGRDQQADMLPRLLGLPQGYASGQRQEQVLRLLMAAIAGDVTAVRDLVAHGTSPQATDGYGVSALMYSVLGAYTDLVLELINWGAHVNQRDLEGCTAFMWAVTTGNVDAARLLLAYGADMDIARYASPGQCPCK
jgi:uncharacterized protein